MQCLPMTLNFVYDYESSAVLREELLDSQKKGYG